MSRDSSRASPSRQPDLFGPPSQGELFVPPPAADPGIIQPEIVRMILTSVIGRLAAAKIWWDWSDWDVQRFRVREPALYCGMLPEAEAAEWRGRIDAEIARLDAVSGTERPPWPQRASRHGS